MMATGVNNEDEWEYEYSTTETQSYFVDLDLTTANRIHSRNAKTRKTLMKRSRATQDQSLQENPIQTGMDQPGNLETGNDRHGSQELANEEGEDDENQEGNSLSRAQSPTEAGSLEKGFTGRVQVLDFDSTNPIVSCDGHIYSCTWHDMLGTMMFVTRHQEAPFHEPQVSTEDYDLIGTSHIKLVGRRVRPVPRTGTRKRKRDESPNKGMEEDRLEQPAEVTNTAGLQQSILDGKSLGSIKRTNPRVNVEIKQQASFLEKLMEVKKVRGETDTVRTVVDRHTVAADARRAKGKGKARGNHKKTEEQRLRLEIRELNKRVVKGDNSALERLQEIYADMEDIEDEEG